MILVSQTPAEFRIKRKYESQNGSISYFYTFECDDLGSFELWAKDDLNLEKGKLYTLVFSMSFYQGSQKVSLKEVKLIGK